MGELWEGLCGGTEEMGMGALVDLFLLGLHDFGLGSLEDLGFMRGLENLKGMGFFLGLRRGAKGIIGQGLKEGDRVFWAEKLDDNAKGEEGSIVFELGGPSLGSTTAKAKGCSTPNE